MNLNHLSDDALVASLHDVRTAGRKLDGRLIMHLVEVEDRRLHLKAACSSLFDFCLRRLHMSEGAAFRRINAARLVRRFPGLLCHIESGAVHLSTLVLLRDHFAESNIDELVAATSGNTKREVEELVARRAPRPDVPSRIRKLPGPVGERAPAAAPGALFGAAPAAAAAAAPGALFGAAPAAAAAPGALFGAAPAPALGALFGAAPAAASSAAPRVPARIEPLSASRYKVQLTVSAELREKLERAKDLMRHRNPSGDLAVVVEEALDALVAKLEKERLGKAIRPRRTVRYGDGSRVRRGSTRGVRA
jgi:hypothetical protein